MNHAGIRAAVANGDGVDPEPFVDVETAGRFLGVKTSWLYDQVRLNKVPSYKLGALRRFRLSELEAWALGNGKPVPSSPKQIL